MRETWRWFGPKDQVTQADIRQAGAQGVVTALYHIPPGEDWSPEAIATRLHEVTHHADGRPTGLTWDVVESLPVSEEIKTAGPARDAHLAAYRESLRNLAGAGIQTICYNFMPVLDWTRTELKAPMATGALALRFDLVDFACFDIHVLGRAGAAADYPHKIRDAAQDRALGLTDTDRDRLTGNILAGLPGTVQGWELNTIRGHLDRYAGVNADTLRANFKTFLAAVIPEAEALGLRLCCHPDDPPWPLLGLPRVMSTEADYAWLVAAQPSPANGITFCTGSLGAHPDNDLPGMVARLGPHIHFLHLRNVRREDGTVPGSFYEDDHLAGSTDMVAVIAAVLAEEARRHAQGRTDAQIPMRPDHGQEILDDQTRGAAPGYPAIGRLKGLAELRGVAAGLGFGTAPG